MIMQSTTLSGYKYLLTPFIFLISFFISIPTIIQAQDSVLLDTVVVSKEVVVSSNRIPQTSGGTGRNITIIPASMIEAMPARTTDEVLRYVPGIEVQSRGAFGVQSDFSLRGSTFSQVLVLVDGMRINDPLTAHFNANIPVAPSEIRRIEVLHGPAAAQYGADAMGGVINIITHTFGSQGAAEGTDARIEAGYGQYELKLGKVGFSRRGEGYRLSGGGIWHQSPGQQLADDYRNRFNIANASVSGGTSLGSDWDLALRTGYDYRDFNARHFYTNSPYDDATERVTAWWNQMRLQKATESSVTTLKGAFKRNTDRFVFNPQVAANEHTTMLSNLQVNRYRQLSGQWDLSYGAQAYHRMIRSTDRGDHSNWHYAGYSMLQWQPSDPLTFSGSLQLDHDDNYGTELMPQLSFSYQQKRWILRASGGRSVRAPSYTERFISTNLEGPLTGGRNLGNPWLEAERAWSGELGTDLFPLQNVRFSATGFYRRSFNLIDYVVTNSGQIRNDGNLQPDTDYLYAQNINSVKIAGLETELSVSSRLGSGWSINGTVGYSFTDFFGDTDVASKYLSSYARHLVNGVVTLRKGAFDGAISSLWKQRQSDSAQGISAFKGSSYNVWNAELGYRLTQHLSLGVQVDNLFDTEYQDILGARMPGRWVMGSVSWRL